MTNTLISAALAAATFAASAASAQPMALDRGLATTGDAQVVQAQWHGGCYRGERPGDCRDRLRWERGGHRGHWVWRDGRYVNDDPGAAIAGGILGFALGAAIAGSASDRDYYVAHRHDRGWRARCRAAYPGFDWNTGTYIGPDGYRHYCVR
jgi:hypothetical protein